MADENNRAPARNFMPMRPPGRGSGGHRRNLMAEKPKDLRGTLKRLWRFFGREKGLLVLIFGFVAVDGVLLLTVPYLIGRGVDLLAGGAHSVPFNALGKIVILLLCLYLGDFLLTFFNNFLIAGASQRIVKGMRRALFDKIQTLPVSYFDRHSHGDLMSRFTNDIDNISSTISQSTVSLMSDVVAIVGSLLMMVILNPPLTLVSLVMVPFVLLLSRLVAGRTRKLFKEQQNALGKLNGEIEESISGLLVIKAFNHEEQVIKDFERTNQELLSVGTRAQIISGYLMPMMNVIGNLGFALIAGVGGVFAVYGIVSIGVIASFLSYSKQFSRPLNDVANLFNTLQTAVAGAERFFEVMDTASEKADDVFATELREVRGEVEFQDVSFAYREGVTVLNHVSFKADAGSTVALVGPTGAGKTTVVNLLNRFYDVSGGEILLDGKNINAYTRASLRQSFGIVLQDTYLFTGTIRENIRYGNLAAGDEAVIRAAGEAGADAFIRKLEKGYDTILSESGSNLSAGQRQLIAIARAILADPAILILDEATSNVDTRTEMKIQQALMRLMQGRTCFIIAHRLSTIRDADVIMVIDNGRIVETGSHEELLEKRGFYCRLYDSQFRNIAT